LVKRFQTAAHTAHTVTSEAGVLIYANETSGHVNQMQ